MLRPIVAVLAIVLLAGSPAVAKKGGKGHGKGGHEHSKHDDDHEHHHDHGDDHGVNVNVDVVFRPEQRVVYREYWGKQYGKKCPPGLAKKNNGCLPPGLAKKRYQVGHPLPREVVIVPVPPELHVHIGVPPVGYIYGMIDGDLVKLAAGTLLVVDALEGLSD